MSYYKWSVIYKTVTTCNSSSGSITIKRRETTISSATDTALGQPKNIQRFWVLAMASTSAVTAQISNIHWKKPFSSSFFPSKSFLVFCWFDEGKFEFLCLILLEMRNICSPRRDENGNFFSAFHVYFSGIILSCEFPSCMYSFYDYGMKAFLYVFVLRNLKLCFWYVFWWKMLLICL